MATHEDYVRSVRAKIVALAQGMLEGSVPYLEGCIRLHALLVEADLADNDADLTAFKAVESEIDHLPIGSVRERWSKEALERLEPEIERSTQWARKITTGSCISLVARFSQKKR